MQCKRALIALLSCFCTLFGATNVEHIALLNNQDSIELTLHLDSAYDKSPKLTQQEGYKGIILQDLSAKSQNEQVNSAFLKQVQIFNIKDSLYVLGIGDVNVIDVNVAKSSKALKVIFSKKNEQSALSTLLQSPFNAKEVATATQIVQQNLESSAISNPSAPDSTLDSAQNAESELSYKADLGIETWRYVAVLVLLAILALVLWVVKRYMVHKKGFASYFSAQKPFDPQKVEVVAQKHIDAKHKILTLESNGYRYLVLIAPNSTTLIDRYAVPKGATIDNNEQIVLEDQFTKLLEQKQARLAKYLQDKG